MFHHFLNLGLMRKIINQIPNRNSHALILSLAITWLLAAPLAAQNNAVTASNQATPSKSAVKYEGVYVVIKANTPKETLLGIEEKIKKLGINFKVNDVTYKDASITQVTVSVEIPGMYNGTLTSGNKQEPLTKPIFFYVEGNQVGLHTGEVPSDISARGRAVVQDNLNGLAILYYNDAVEFSGTVSTNWKSR